MTEEIEKLLYQQTVICSMGDPVAVAYTSVYEEGDVWIKTVGCEGCPVESQEKCCAPCPIHLEKGCYFHLMKPNNMTKKPFGCVVNPEPVESRYYCQLEFKCIRGVNMGKIRCVRDKWKVLR